jgi:hypothetical protein
MSGGNCVVLLIDESSAMSAVMREKLPDGTESTKTNAQRIATSINNLLRQLGEGPRCDIAVVGYRSDPQGQADVGSRWSGGLAGREFVSSDELGAAARLEKRTKKVPRPDGSLDETTIDFPVWYEPVLGGKAPQIAVFKHCRDLLARWAGSEAGAAGQALVVHVFSGASGDGSPQMAIDELLRLDGPGGRPIVVQCHMAASSALVTSAFPSKQAFLAAGLARDLFSRASELPQAMRDALKAVRAVAQPAARAVVHNAKMADLFRCLELAKCHVAGNTGGRAAVVQVPVSPVAVTPAPTVSTPQLVGDAGAAESPRPVAVGAGTAAHAGEPVGLAVLILDRSVADPFAGSLTNPCSRLQEAANESLKQLSSKKYLDLAIDAAIVSYGLGSDNQPDVRATFEGQLAGKSLVRNSELPDGAIRVEESEVEASNGVGGLMTIKKKTPIYFDVEPTGSVSPQGAFSAAAAIITDWCSQHPTGLPPIVLHLTRGEQTAADIEAAVAAVTSLVTSAGSTMVHTLVVTETPCRSAAFPETAADLETDTLRALWQTCSLLRGWEALAAAKRPYITAASRGFVVNGKFDVLGEEFTSALKPS